MYGEIEKAKQQKRSQRFWMNIGYLACSASTAIVILILLGYNIKDIFVRNFSEELFLVQNTLRSQINGVYYLIAVWKSTFAYIMSCINGEAPFNFQYISTIWETLSHKTYFEPKLNATVFHKNLMNKNGMYIIMGVAIFVGLYWYIHNLFKGESKLWKQFIYYPLSALFFATLGQEEQKKFMFKGGWLKNFVDTMFLRSVQESDAYLRAHSLEFFDRYPFVLCGENYVYMKEYLFMKHLFMNDEAFNDLFLIIEGYLTRPKSFKKSFKEEFLTMFGAEVKTRTYNQPYLFDKAVSITKEQMRDYRCFNGKDEVSLSMEAIMYFLDAETANFNTMLISKGFRGRNYLSLQMRRYLESFYRYPERNTKMLFGINNRKKEILQYGFERENYELFKDFKNPPGEDIVMDRIVFVITSYFRFVLFREIMQRYMNLPAGTVVVKIDDYTLRMIMDTYAAKNLVRITEDKNDGSNRQFESDELANLFMFAYWFYHDISYETTLTERLNYCFNTDVLIMDDVTGGSYVKQWAQEANEAKKLMEEAAKQQDKGL